MKSLAELAAIKAKMQNKVLIREGASGIRVVDSFIPNTGSLCLFSFLFITLASSLSILLTFPMLSSGRIVVINFFYFFLNFILFLNFI